MTHNTIALLWVLRISWGFCFFSFAAAVGFVSSVLYHSVTKGRDQGTFRGFARPVAAALAVVGFAEWLTGFPHP